MNLFPTVFDTDSPKKGCTTYIAALLVEKLSQMGLTFVDYPHLIRLNPNVPWKTRGNGAVCIRVCGKEDVIGNVRDITIELVEKESDLGVDGTDPGIVFYFGEKVPLDIGLIKSVMCNLSTITISSKPSLI